jgi:hypothetical protein
MLRPQTPRELIIARYWEYLGTHLAPPHWRSLSVLQPNQLKRISYLIMSGLLGALINKSMSDVADFLHLCHKADDERALNQRL